jgi:hypothetical protein
MNKFGILKSKIDRILLESYKNKESFKNNLKIFNSLILENKELAKMYWLYDELKTKKGLDISIVNDYLNETILQFHNINKKINQKKINKIVEWVKNVNETNQYEDIDNIFSENVMNIETKIKSKKIISESLTKPSTITKEKIELPLSVMVNVANKTINTYIEQLNENDKNKLIKFLSTDTEEMKKNYTSVKESVIEKLSVIKNNSDVEVSNRIEETIEKIKNEKFDKLNYFRLNQLNESI